MKDAYIVTAIRTPGCKQNKGAFKNTRPDDLLAFILKTAVEKTPSLEMKDVDDIMVGCAFPEAEQGINIGRVAAQMAGFPVEVPGATVNRFCASGLEAISLCALRIMAGWADIAIGGGVESMTFVPIGGLTPRPNPELTKQAAFHYMSMGITAENVASRYHISRELQDEFAYESQMKASHAQQNNLFKEIVPTPATNYVLTENGTYKKEVVLQKTDDGVRPDTTPDGLAALNPVFVLGGHRHAGQRLPNDGRRSRHGAGQ